MEKSVKLSFDTVKMKKWAKNTLVFLAPALLVLLTSTAHAIPSDYKYGAIVLFIINVAYDFLRKLVSVETIPAPVVPTPAP